MEQRTLVIFALLAAMIVILAIAIRYGSPNRRSNKEHRDRARLRRKAARQSRSDKE